MGTAQSPSRWFETGCHDVTAQWLLQCGVAVLHDSALLGGGGKVLIVITTKSFTLFNLNSLILFCLLNSTTFPFFP